MNLVYCAAGSRKYAQIAMERGFLYGAQLPNKIYYTPWFVDNDFKSDNPSLPQYFHALSEHQPYMASVIDWDKRRSLDDVLKWASAIRFFVNRVMIIPKIPGSVCDVPHEIDGVKTILGYSVPSKFSKTDVPLSEFGNRQVHLLGGTPHVQLRLCDNLNVFSVDGNAMQKMSNLRRYWTNGKWELCSGGCYDAFKISCDNVMAAFNW